MFVHPVGFWGLGLAVVAALIGLSVGYKFGFEYVCRDAFPAAFCQGLSLGVPRAFTATVLIALVLLLRPTFRHNLGAVLTDRVRLSGCAVAMIGFTAILMPLLVYQVSGDHLPEATLLLCWLGGLGVWVLGLLIAVLDWTKLRATQVRTTLLWAACAGALGALVPDLVLLAQPLWAVSWITEVTFEGVQLFLVALGQTVTAEPATKALGIDDFIVLVGAQCSGVEGFALLTVFTSVYLGLFWRQLRIARAWLMLPIALFASWCMNVLRIAVLVLIGRYVSPDLAINGFHSHAGWLVFLTLALSLALAFHNIAWFHKPVGSEPADVAMAGQAAKPLPFFQDPIVAYVLPFIVFMLSSTLTSAASGVPALLYPLRMLAVLAVVYMSRSVFLRLNWRIDPLAVGAGVVCGVLWVVTAPPAAAADTALSLRLATLSPLLLGAWVLCRVVGTAVVVPLLEEAFFRGYLQSRIAGMSGVFPGRFHQVMPWVGLAVSAVLFGVLHDRVLAGVLAGALFGLLYLRRERLADAIYAHGAANAVIAAVAVADGAWHLI